MGARARVTVVGSTMIDLVVYTDRVPGPGETLVGRSFQMGFGGKGANQAVMASRLGADVRMVNCLGADDYGRLTLGNFASQGVDTAHVATEEGVASGVAQIWVEPDGTNRIIIIPGANQRLDPTRAVAGVASAAGEGVVVAQLEVPQTATAAAFSAARAAGLPTILNPAPAAPLDPALLAETDWLLPNEVEFADLSGGADASRDADLVAVGERFGTRLLVTLGGAGAALVTGGTVMRFAAPRVDVKDTTGAGDAFVGAFATALALGMPAERAVEAAIRCASDSVTRPGTQSSFPEAAAARRLLGIADA